MTIVIVRRVLPTRGDNGVARVPECQSAREERALLPKVAQVVDARGVARVQMGAPPLHLAHLAEREEALSPAGASRNALAAATNMW